ncbi:hypothetical protein ACL9RL_03575 [Plantibacter sp. Mn2098]|uniref:hypothetical protein n=1 Tax=Plantibacter sp. Mn2098 TaxID=3395266 RepID=UPI003BC01554
MTGVRSRGGVASRLTRRHRAGLAIVVVGVVLVGGVVASAVVLAAGSEQSSSAGIDPSGPLPWATPIVEGADANPDAELGSRSPGTVDYSRTPPGWFDARTPPATLRAAADPESVSWNLLHQIVAVCMARQGFWYSWTDDWSLELPGDRGGRLASDANLPDGDAARAALYGASPAGAGSRWQDGGCRGYAVHTMGNDDAN